jgi:hypothetical protein
VVARARSALDDRGRSDPRAERAALRVEPGDLGIAGPDAGTLAALDR